MSLDLQGLVDNISINIEYNYPKCQTESHNYDNTYDKLFFST